MKRGDTFLTIGAPIYFSGFEETIIDSDKPYVVSQTYTEAGPTPAIVVEFSESVIGTTNPMQPYYLELINTTTSEQIFYGLMALDYDSGTNVGTFTFPGLLGGRLSTGDYSARLLGGASDFYGNLMDDQPLLFFTPTPVLLGDYDGNGEVAQADYDVWRAHFGESVAPGTFGDGNGDGTVDAADYTIWRDHLGATSGAGAALATGSEGQAVGSGNDERSGFEDVQSRLLSRGVGSVEFAVPGRPLAKRSAFAREGGLSSTNVDRALLSWSSNRTEAEIGKRWSWSRDLEVDSFSGTKLHPAARAIETAFESLADDGASCNRWYAFGCRQLT